MRISRPCYDKYNRCPGWAGGGWKHPKKDSRYPHCDDGSIKVDYEDRFWMWKFWKCNKCDVVVLPWVTKFLMSPRAVKYRLENKVQIWWTLRGEPLVFGVLLPKVGYYSKRYWEAKK